MKVGTKKNKVLLTTLLVVFWLLPLVGIDLEYTPRELIVKTVEPVRTRGNSFEIAELDEFLADMVVREIKPVTPSAQNRYHVVRLENEFEWENVRQRLQQPSMRRSSQVEYVQPNYINRMLVRPNDPYFTQQDLDIMRIPQAWNYETGSDQIIVALIDSGLWFDHPEFECQTNIWINESEYPPNGEDSSGNGYVDDWRGWNFVDAPELANIAMGNFIGQDNEPFDETGHGTHIAGIVGAKANNNEGIAGTCWNVKMMILRAGFRTTTGSGMLQDDDAAAAIIYAADNGAHIINISWGSESFSRMIADACQYAYERGVIVVASAGNTPKAELMYPARLNTTIAVGAVNSSLQLTGFSSFGPDLDIVALGQDVLSTYIEREESLYIRMSGTSMSAPFVSGAVALLLSQEPGLNFEEVTSRLYSSARKLDNNGFSNIFGHGLLDVEALLTEQYRPYIKVTYPMSNQGMSSSFDIVGSVTADNFFRYSVMYTKAVKPDLYDWKDVYRPIGSNPYYYHDQVEDGVIARFNVPYTLPDDDYLVRIRVETIEENGSRSYEKRIRVPIVQSLPELDEQSLWVYRRYQGHLPAYFLQAAYDQETTLQVDIKQGTQDIIATTHSNYADTLHILKLPDSLQDGPVSVRLTAENIAGETITSNWYNDIAEIEKTPIPTDRMQSSAAGPPLIAVGKSYDFAGNGVPSFIGTDISEEEEEGDGSSGSVAAFELNRDRIMERNYIFEDNFLPLDIGNTNNQGEELLGLVLDTAVIIERYGQSDYPNIPIWSHQDVAGGNFGDCFSNGRDELLLIRNLHNERVISIFERVEDPEEKFEERNRLINESETETRNNFVPRIAVADLNNNGNANVLAADTDGDIMVFEIESPEKDTLLFTHRLPVPNAYHLAIADFTGDGNKEFVVGGYNYQYSDPNKIYWFFEFFGYDESKEEFLSLGFVSFDHFESVNSIGAMDMITTHGNRGREELVLALTPYLYVVAYEDGEFKPIWKGESHSTYQVVALPTNPNSPAGVLVNAYENERIRSHFITLDDFSGPPAPSGLTAQPVDESSISLQWETCSAEKYIIYRGEKVTDDSWESTVIDTVNTSHYYDTELQRGVSYRYSLKSYNSSYTPHYSRMSISVDVTPFSVPQIIAISMTGNRQINMLFDTQLSNQAVNVGHYKVNNGIGIPRSVNHTHNHRGLQLRFNKELEPFQEQYLIEIDGLQGRSGVYFPAGSYPFDYIEDSEPPKVVEHFIQGDRQLLVRFNKILNKEIAENKENYKLKTPLVDPFNTIESVTNADSTLTINFSSELRMTSQPYTMRMDNIEDMFGNRILNSDNILSFTISDIDNLDYIQVVPNPFISNRPGHTGIRFVKLPQQIEGDIYIYSLAGELIFADKIRTDSNSVWEWNLKNSSHNRVSSGTYFYVLKVGEHLARGQLVIVN